ncbi:MAG TPA: hypothetical protein VMT74_01570 [Gaiellaceae bacterium]|nr:hypothetical protein [Gaiellaceae bacterium]
MSPRTTPDYLAVRHILTSPRIAERTAPHLGEDGVDWQPLLAEAETMSSGERLLVRIAYDLWHADGDVALWELPRRLDRSGFRRVVRALELSRGEPAAHELEDVGAAA